MAYQRYVDFKKIVGFLGVMLAIGFWLGVNPATVHGQSVPEAGTTIGNQASATYIDAEGNERTVTSNSVETMVQQVASVSLSSGLDVTVASGGQALFPHTITNNGNGTDSFDLSAIESGTNDFDFSTLQVYADANQDGVPDDLNTPITETPNLGPGESFGIVVAATVPTGLTDGDMEELSLDVTSAFDASETASEISTATIGDAAVITVTKSMSQTSGSPADTVTVTFTFRNTGNTIGTNLNITDNLNISFDYIPDSGLWSGSGSALTDGTGGDPAGIDYSYDDGTGTVEATIAELTPGETGTLQFDVEVGPGTDGQEISNVGNYNHDDIPSPLQTNIVTFSVGGVHGIGPGPETVTIPSTPQGSTIYFINEYENTGTLEDVFNITIDDSNAPEYPEGTTFIPYASDGSGNPTNPLSDSNGDGIPDTGPVAPGSPVQVILQVSLPIEAVGDNGGSGYEVEKTATSVEDPTQSVTHTDRLGEIEPNLIDLTADAPVGDPDVLGDGAFPTGEPAPVVSGSGAAGSTVTFDLYVNNTGPQADNFDLSASTDNTFGTMTLPDGWRLEFRDPANGNTIITNTGTIASGDEKQVTAAVILPSDSEADPEQSIFIRALSSASGAADVIHTSVTLSTDRAVTVEPNHTGQVANGSTIVYEHVLTNNSTIDENDGTNSTLELELSQTQSTGFLSELYYDANDDGVIDNGDVLIATAGEASELPASVGTLTPGDQISLLVKVTALSGVAPTTTNTTIITVNDNMDQEVNSVLLPEDTASDISTVVESALTITKRQALDDGSGNPGTYQTGGLNADPGSVIYYQIEVENETADQVTEVEVTDRTPAYTTLSGPVTTSGDGSPVVSSDPGDGNNGIIRVTASTLNSGERFVIEFAVTIDD